MVSQMNDTKVQEEYDKLYKRIIDETRSNIDEEQKNKSNRILYWNYTLEDKYTNFDDFSSKWFKINQEDYQEKGPLKLIKKEEFIEIKIENITVEDSKDELYESLQLQINTLLETVHDLERILKHNSKLNTIYVNKPTSLKNWNHNLKHSFDIEGTYAKSFVINFDKNILVVGTKNGIIYTYNLNSWDLIDRLSLHHGTVKDIVYLNDLSTIISVGNDGKIIKTDLETKISKIFCSILPSAIKSIVYVCDGCTVYLACEKTLYSFDTNTCLELDDKATFESEPLKLVYFKEKKCLAIGFRNGFVSFYCLLLKMIICEFTHHLERITDLAAIRFNGSVAIASNSKDKTINIYGIEENILLKSLKVPESKSTFHSRKVIYGHDEKTLISTHDDGKIIFHNFNTGDDDDKEHTTKMISSSIEKISSAIYCQDGFNFIIAKQSGKIEIFNTK